MLVSLENKILDTFSNKRKKFGNVLHEPLKVGKLNSIVGTVIECTGIDATLGELFGIENIDGNIVEAEVIGIKNGKTLLLPFNKTIGLKEGCIVYSLGAQCIKVGKELVGRVLDANANPIDGKGKLQDIKEELYKNHHHH